MNIEYVFRRIKMKAVMAVVVRTAWLTPDLRSEVLFEDILGFMYWDCSQLSSQ